jgi:predicted double-glycine peptidase
MNEIVIGNLIIATCLAILGWQAAHQFPPASRRVRAALLLLAGALLVPLLMFYLYFLHWVDFAWYYEWRSWIITDWLPALAGFSIGVLSRYYRYRLFGVDLGTRGEFLGVLLAVGLLTSFAFAKPYWESLDTSLIEESWRDDVCLQSTASTCGPAAAATVLRALGASGPGERGLADAAFTSQGGTLLWYLARSLRRLGYEVRFKWGDRIEVFQKPAVVGVILANGTGHFIAVIDDDHSTVTLGDPLIGRETLHRTEFDSRYVVNGIGIEITRNDTAASRTTRRAE